MRYYHDRCGNLFVDRGMGSFEPLGAAVMPGLLTELSERTQTVIAPPPTQSAKRRAAVSSAVSAKPGSTPPDWKKTYEHECWLKTSVDPDALLEPETVPCSSPDKDVCCKAAQDAADLLHKLQK